MRYFLLLLIPLGLAGCGPEASVPPRPSEHSSLPMKKAAPAPPRAEAKPPADQAELTDEEMDEIDEIIDGILEEELKSP